MSNLVRSSIFQDESDGSLMWDSVRSGISQGEFDGSFLSDLVRSGISRDEAGRKEYAVYEITVTKTNYDGTAMVWKVLRRYSDFHDLHNNIKDKVTLYH